MVSKYERGVLVFSDDSEMEEIQRIEKSIRRSLPALGISCDQGVVLASATRSSQSSLMEKDNLSSVFNLGERAGMVSAGRVADAQSLAEGMRDKALEDISKYGELEDVNVLVKEVAEDVRETRQEIPYRPYGVQMIVGGVNGGGKPELYKVDLDGVVTSWSAVAVGSQTDEIMTELESEYERSNDIEECTQIAVNKLLKYSSVGSEGLSVATITENSDLYRLGTDEIEEHKLDKGDQDE